MVCIGMSIDDCCQLPALCFQNFLHFSTRILVIATVNEPYIIVADTVYPHFRRAIDIIGVCCHLNQFIHKNPSLDNKLLCFYFIPSIKALQEHVSFPVQKKSNICIFKQILLFLFLVKYHCSDISYFIESTEPITFLILSSTSS